MSTPHATQSNDKASTAFANPVALAAFAGSVRVQEGVSNSLPNSAPQMASLVDLIEDTSSPIDASAGRSSRLSRLGKLRTVRRVRRAGWPVLNMTTGLLSNAFPTAAPLFHGCLAFLQLRLQHKNQAESLPTTQGHRVL